MTHPSAIHRERDLVDVMREAAPFLSAKQRGATTTGAALHLKDEPAGGRVSANSHRGPTRFALGTIGICHDGP
jgi:hypothetical protein